MAYRRDPSSTLTAGLWLIGLGMLLASRQFWPGILFLAGATALVQAHYHPEKRHAARTGVILLLLGVWVLTRFSLPILLVGLGIWMVSSAIASSTPSGKPYIDRTLD